MEVTVSFDFSKIGHISLIDGKLRFPEVLEEPGIYQFAIRDSIYVGETERLRRRFQHYRTPGLSQPTNIRISRLIELALIDGFQVLVSTIVRASINVGGSKSLLDLSQKSARLFVESAVLSSAHLTGQHVENL